MRFGDKVKEQRVNRGITQEELAKAIGVSKRTMGYYEQGKTYPQNREIYRRLADYFEVDINYFLTENEVFLTDAADKYGRHGFTQAKLILEQAAAFFAGGGLSESDKEAFFYEIQELYMDSKERAKKYTPKKYTTNDDGK